MKHPKPRTSLMPPSLSIQNVDFALDPLTRIWPSGNCQRFPLNGSDAEREKAQGGGESSLRATMPDAAATEVRPNVARNKKFLKFISRIGSSRNAPVRVIAGYGEQAWNWISIYLSCLSAGIREIHLSTTLPTHNRAM